jgi:hypothetical protein
MNAPWGISVFGIGHVATIILGIPGIPRSTSSLGPTTNPDADVSALGKKRLFAHKVAKVVALILEAAVGSRESS